MRIGIVNDSLIARVALQRVVMSVLGHDVAWMARDGAEAVEMARSDGPDLILMDLIMPGIDGVEATRRIMAQSPCPIVIVTSSVTGHLGKVYEAMGLGALDAVDTPELGPSGDLAGARLLLEKIGTVAKLIGRAPRPAFTPVEPVANRTRSDVDPAWPLVLLGSSTGGPAALALILAGLPDSPRWATVIVQHVDSALARGLAQWLGERTNRRVELVEPGDRPLPGRVLLAATDDHVILDKARRFHYVAEPAEMHYRPSVDVFFRSVAERWPEPGVAALLTGMGRDGAAGLMALKRAGWLTIAQDEATSVIWGMPGAAVQVGAADRVLPVSQIAPAIVDRLSERHQRPPGATRP
jgi:two-component system, chemotaxis family, response regulator WspF